MKINLDLKPGVIILQGMSHDAAVSMMAGFMASLYAKGKKSATIKGYSGQARSWIGLRGGPDMRRSAFLAGVWRRIKRLCGKDTCKKMAVTTRFMREVRKELDMETELGANLWCAALAAYCGLLRSSEYSIKKETQPPPMRDGEIKEGHNDYGDFVELYIGRSKGDQFGAGARTTVAAADNDEDMCLVRAVRHMRSRFPKQGKDPAAFEEAPGKTLQYHTMTKLLRRVAVKLKMNKSWVGTHSLRAGGASALSRQGAPPWLIKAIGRWKSDAYEGYIRSSSYGHWSHWAAQALAINTGRGVFVHEADHHSQAHKASVTEDMVDMIKKAKKDTL